MGKRRTGMGRISDRQRRDVTFSKRRKGLFKKAQELCCLTGATVGIICISEAGNPFTFAYPPPANGNDGRLFSILQQHYGKLPAAVEESKFISENISKGLFNQRQAASIWGCIVEDEQEVRLQGQMQSMDEADRALLGSVPGQPMVDEQRLVEADRALLDSVPGQPMVDEQRLVDSSVYGYVSSSSYFDSSCLPPPLSPIDALLSSPPSLPEWKDNLDLLEMDTRCAFDNALVTHEKEHHEPDAEKLRSLPRDEAVHARCLHLRTRDVYKELNDDL
ncbi:Agamous-like MADS-box protein [Nymphaea thermarum]|nr:Agamous-like MADS-box protein [Nymphaea thermarum]